MNFYPFLKLTLEGHFKLAKGGHFHWHFQLILVENKIDLNNSGQFNSYK